MKLALSSVVVALIWASQTCATCFEPEPAGRICYNEGDAKPQSISLKEIAYVAKYLRNYGSERNSPAFYTMAGPEADNCAEWQVTAKGSTWVMAKLVGDDAASVTFDDVANTIDGGANATPDQKAAALFGCDTNAGQMGVAVNTADPRYQEEQFRNGTHLYQRGHCH